MDERRFRLALDTITETIEEYGEDTVVAAFRTILERFDYEVVKRDPGPDCCDYGRYYSDRGVMYPVHGCPSPAPSDDEELVMRAFNLPVVNLTRRLL